MAIGRQPRVRLAALPTPLHEVPRFREALGGERRAPRILIKRDDLTGLAFGGNKARKLEFLVADARRQGATALVTTGAVQSNHARMTAAAACAVGLRASLVLTGQPPGGPPEGNLLLDYLLGAEVRCVDGARLDAEVETVLEALRTRGERPYLIPIGGSSPVGALGYVAGTLELVTQLAERGEAPSRLYYASGSRGTQAGLVLGARLYSAPYRLFGMAVSSGLCASPMPRPACWASPHGWLPRTCTPTTTTSARPTGFPPPAASRPSACWPGRRASFWIRSIPPRRWPA
jgi:L-cysteate sulfo-lyase